MIENFTIGTMYKSYTETVPKELRVNKKIFLDITAAFNKFIITKLLDAYEIKLPHLGYLRIEQIKAKIKIINGKIRGLPPDWKATSELYKKDPQAKIDKKIIFHTNEHTNGKYCKLVWSNNGLKARYNRLYLFKPSRTILRTLAQKIKQGKQYYNQS